MYRKVAFTLALITLILFSDMLVYAQATAPSTPPAEPTLSLSTKKTHTEDWTTISLAKSNLPLSAIGGVVLSKIKFPECTRELVRFEWRPGDPIDIYVIRPQGVDKPAVVLYLFNYNTDTDIFRDEGWCKRVQQDGVAAVGFVSALAGQRFHMPRPMKEWFVSELQEALSTSTHDVQMILNYLDSRSDLDMKRVGMFGHGSGGSIAILAASADPRIVALDVIDPWGDWPDWLKGSKQIPASERPTYLTPEFLQSVSDLDPISYLSQWKGNPLRIEQVMDDPVTPPTARDRIASLVAEKGYLVRYQDRASEVEAWGGAGLSGWLTEQLKHDEPGTVSARNQMRSTPNHD